MTQLRLPFQRPMTYADVVRVVERQTREQRERAFWADYIWLRICRPDGWCDAYGVE